MDKLSTGLGRILVFGDGWLLFRLSIDWGWPRSGHGAQRHSPVRSSHPVVVHVPAGLTWLLFLVLLCSLLYIRDLSGYVNSADVAAIPGNYTYFVAAFGLSFETSEYYETQWWDYTIGVLIVAVFLVFVYLAINLQIYYRLTFGNYILGIALGLSITRRAAGALGKNASAQIIGPAILVIFGIYLVYLLVTIFLWNLLPSEC